MARSLKICGRGSCLGEDFPNKNDPYSSPASHTIITCTFFFGSVSNSDLKPSAKEFELSSVRNGKFWKIVFTTFL